jgi:hypothetical protein
VKRESRHFYAANAKLLEIYERLVPLRRMGEADDSADAIDFLRRPKLRHLAPLTNLRNAVKQVAPPGVLAAIREFRGMLDYLI